MRWHFGYSNSHEPRLGRRSTRDSGDLRRDFEKTLKRAPLQKDPAPVSAMQCRRRRPRAGEHWGARVPDLRSKVEGKIEEILETNFELQERITDDTNIGEALRNHPCNEHIPCRRRVEELLNLQESKTLEFKSSL